MPGSSHVLSSRRVVALTLVLVGLAPPAAAQTVVPRTEDATVPEAGEMRFRISPAFQSWHERFGATGSAEPRPLASFYNGALLARVFPGPDAFVDDLNADADALGFDPLTREQVEPGRLDVREINVDVRTLPLTVEAGLPWGLALDFTVPVVRTETESFFTFDGAGATLAPAAAALASPTAFFTAVSSARSQLQQQIDGGGLSPAERQQAENLLAASGAFVTALEARVGGNGFLPLAGTSPGAQIAAHYQGLADGFQDFGLSLPAFTLPETVDRASVDAFLAGTADGSGLGGAGHGFTVGELEAGVRLRVLDSFRTEGGGVQARTSVGARLRYTAGRAPDESPFSVPGRFLAVPVGDGQRDVELSLYQDLRWGMLAVSVVARYGFQLADRLTARVHPPGLPLALPSVEAELERDLGDYVQARVAPRIALSEYLEVGLEYRLWRKEKDLYTLAEGEGLDEPLASLGTAPLELGTEALRHRLGVSASYGTGLGGPPASDAEVGFVHQVVLEGSGVRTPVSGLTSFYVRVPVGVF